MLDEIAEWVLGVERGILCCVKKEEQHPTERSLHGLRKMALRYHVYLLLDYYVGFAGYLEYNCKMKHVIT